MDKIQYINSRGTSRQGFALMITLSVLSVIIALTMVLLSYFEEVQQDASNTKALIQADVYYTDITKIFQGLEDKKTLFSILYTAALPINSPDGKISLILQCEPLSKGVNINWLGWEHNTTLQKTAEEIFEVLAQEYNMEDAGRLQEMLYEEIVSSNESSLEKQSRLHQKKGIISFQQFESIVSRYQFEVDDPKIANIPWEKYFSFFPKSKKIDAEYSSPELISYLFDMDIATVREWAFSNMVTLGVDKVTLKALVSESGGNYAQRKSILADKEFLDMTACSVDYALAEEQYRFRFEYIEGGAKHFEFLGKQ